METQKAYIKQINEDLKMNKEYEKKLSWKNKFYKIIAKNHNMRAQVFLCVQVHILTQFLICLV